MHIVILIFIKAAPKLERLLIPSDAGFSASLKGYGNRRIPPLFSLISSSVLLEDLQYLTELDLSNASPIIEGSDWDNLCSLDLENQTSSVPHPILLNLRKLQNLRSLTVALSTRSGITYIPSISPHSDYESRDENMPNHIFLHPFSIPEISNHLLPFVLTLKSLTLKPCYNDFNAPCTTVDEEELLDMIHPLISHDSVNYSLSLVTIIVGEIHPSGIGSFESNRHSIEFIRSNQGIMRYFSLERESYMVEEMRERWLKKWGSTGINLNVKTE